jgi:hypothetical protein
MNSLSLPSGTFTQGQMGPISDWNFQSHEINNAFHKSSLIFHYSNVKLINTKGTKFNPQHSILDPPSINFLLTCKNIHSISIAPKVLPQ